MKADYTIERGSLDGVEAFVRVAERTNFRAAAADLGVTPSGISQAIRTLEARLGVALFTRTTRSVGLTEAGAAFLAGVRPAFAAIVEASAAARDLGSEPAGLLRLTAPRPVVSLLLQPILASFCEAYPKITVEIEANDELVDLARGGFDAGLRLGEFLAADMVAVRLTPPFRFIVVASPAYLAKRGRPSAPSDLHDHACIRLRRGNGAFAPWRLRGNREAVEISVNGPLVVNDLPSAMGAAVADVGLAQLPERLVATLIEDGKLQEILGQYAPSSDGVFMYFASRNQVMPKLRAFIDHAQASLSRSAGLRAVAGMARKDSAG